MHLIYGSPVLLVALWMLWDCVDARLAVKPWCRRFLPPVSSFSPPQETYCARSLRPRIIETRLARSGSTG